MSHCKFEKALKWDCVKEVTAMVKRGNLTRNEKMDVAEHIACFAGCAAAWAKTSKPTPPGPDIIIRSDTQLEICDTLENLVPEDEGAAQAIDWATVLRVAIPLLLKLLDDMFREWSDEQV